jgi:aromatic ring hydroxylase
MLGASFPLPGVCTVAQALVYRSKLDMLIWNALGTEFRSRQEWYESTTNGNQEQMRADRQGPATLAE